MGGGWEWRGMPSPVGGASKTATARMCWPPGRMVSARADREPSLEQILDFHTRSCSSSAFTPSRAPLPPLGGGWLEGVVLSRRGPSRQVCVVFWGGLVFWLASGPGPPPTTGEGRGAVHFYCE